MHGQFSPQSSRVKLRSLGLRPKKRLSQSFLEDQRVAAAIVRTAQLDATKEVLEVGPGLGVLTERLASAAARVVAVEIDQRLAEALSHEKLTVVNQDVLTFEPGQYFERPFTVVANLPYHITSPALRHLLSMGPPFAQRLVVMVQAEVAERIAAQPGEMSALSVITQVQAEFRIVKQVPASAFYPRPKVDSAVMLVEPLEGAQRLIPRDQVPAFADLVHAGFKQPRKTLANSLADGLGVPKPRAVERLSNARIDPKMRPEDLTLEDWARLFRHT